MTERQQARKRQAIAKKNAANFEQYARKLKRVIRDNNAKKRKPVVAHNGSFWVTNREQP